MADDACELDELELEVAGFRRTSHDQGIALLVADCVVAFARADTVYAVCLRTARGVVRFDVPVDRVQALSEGAAAIDQRREEAAMRSEEAGE
jgi:hypothetical protein